MKILRIILLLCLAFYHPSLLAAEAILKIGAQTVRAEIADTEQSREHGLMQRHYLCDNCGMLFVFEEAGRHSFWMKNTLLPLSIAFISPDGGIINIEEMQAGTIEPHKSQADALYALEMNFGWFARNHISPADKVGLKFVLKPH